MNSSAVITSKKINLLVCTVLLAVVVCAAACATTKLENLDRNAIPQVNSNVAANVSEIREIKYYHDHKEDSHKDLHIAGQLFTKSQVNGISQIKPCGNCVIKLSTADSTISANITTESDGYFSFHSENRTYILTIANPGHNQMQIGPMDFVSEGATVFKIINAAGNSSERFTVTRNDKNYTWR